MWKRPTLAFDLDDSATEHPVVTLTVTTPAGPLIVMGELASDEGGLIVLGFDIQGPGANSLGLANLRYVIRTAMEVFNVGEVVIEGTNRTTGANPGRRPNRLRFTRLTAS